MADEAAVECLPVAAMDEDRHWPGLARPGPEQVEPLPLARTVGDAELLLRPARAEGGRVPGPAGDDRPTLRNARPVVVLRLQVAHACLHPILQALGLQSQRAGPAWPGASNPQN